MTWLSVHIDTGRALAIRKQSILACINKRRRQMRPISRKVQGDGEIFETHYGDKQITFGVPLGSFELSDIMIMNADEAGVRSEDPDYNEILQNLATFAWSMRHPMRVELFVSPELLP